MSFFLSNPLSIWYYKMIRSNLIKKQSVLISIDALISYISEDYLGHKFHSNFCKCSYCQIIFSRASMTFTGQLLVPVFERAQLPSLLTFTLVTPGVTLFLIRAWFSLKFWRQNFFENRIIVSLKFLTYFILYCIKFKLYNSLLCNVHNFILNSSLLYSSFKN